MPTEGSCLCKAIKISFDVAPEPLQVCHCTDCRQFTGAIAAYLIKVPASAFHITGYPSAYANHGDSGAQVKRYFCGNCGSSLYDWGAREPDLYYVQAGLFPPRTLSPPSTEIFVASAEDWSLRYPNCVVQEREVKHL